MPDPSHDGLQFGIIRLHVMFSSIIAYMFEVPASENHYQRKKQLSIERNAMKLSNFLYKIISGICILLQTVSLANIAESTGIAKPVPPADQEVSVGQPSLWSFAQAHYLLASLRERSQAIETKG